MNLIPQPQELIYAPSGTLSLPDSGTLYVPQADARLDKAALTVFTSVSDAVSEGELYALWCGHAPAAHGLPAPLRDLARAFSLDACAGLPDAYRLHIAPEGLGLVSRSAQGLFSGIQTLRQLCEDGNRRLPCMTVRDWAATALRCDHFDLRTVYPTFSHMLCYIEEMARYKINGLLIEYEDKFPFQTLRELRHENALSEAELRLLLKTARDNFIQIIPLQQTYGHLEYVLKHPSYLPLRETPDSVAELCPRKEASYELVCRLIREISDAHPDSRYLHLGGDEVWSIGTCSSCRDAGCSSALLYIRFVNRIAEYALRLGKKPIVWHDMLKDATREELAELDKRITVAVWIYSGRRLRERTEELTARFQDAGLQVLGAPSVRCWDECAAQNYPVAERRLENIDAWISTAGRTGLTGLLFTNWSASLALGNPYGLFESTRYLTFYACERSWNPGSCLDGYPARFFSVYHGITDRAFLRERYELTDYYRIPEAYRPLCSRNTVTARLLEVMRQYEEPAKTGLPLQDLLFRGALYPQSEATMTFLKEKYRENYALYDRVRPLMEELLRQLLPPCLVDMYLASRFYLPEVYRGIAEELFENSTFFNTPSSIS